MILNFLRRSLFQPGSERWTVLDLDPGPSILNDSTSPSARQVAVARVPARPAVHEQERRVVLRRAAVGARHHGAAGKTIKNVI